MWVEELLLQFVQDIIGDLMVNVILNTIVVMCLQETNTKEKRLDMFQVLIQHLIEKNGNPQVINT